MARKKEEKKTTKNSKTKEVLEFLASVAVVVYMVGSLIAFIGGVTSGGSYREYRACYEKPSRLTDLFPAFTLGCYLSASSDQKYYNYDTYKEVDMRNEMEYRIDSLKTDLTWYKNREKLLIDKLEICYENKKKK